MAIFEKQLQHLILLIILLGGGLFLLNPSVLSGQFLGLETRTWLIIAIAIPILHQIYVWLLWRAELHYNWVSQTWGEHGFTYYAIGFTVLILARPISIIALAIANQGTLAWSPLITWPLALILFFPAGYLFYSVRMYFGFKRAYGIDHFDPAYRQETMIRRGIFRWTDNAMYVFGFLVLWTPGLLWLSKAALLAAAFNHLYIWVHYYCTELPDMKRIYGS